MWTPSDLESITVTLDFHDVGTPKQKFLTLHLLQILKHSVKAEVHYAASNAVAWFNKQWHKTGYPKHPTCRIQLLFGLVFSPKEKERFHPPLDRGLSWWAELEGGIELTANWGSMCILLFFPCTVPQIKWIKYKNLLCLKWKLQLGFNSKSILYSKQST